MEVIGFPNYLIYDDGRVWSKPRTYHNNFTTKKGVYVKRKTTIKGRFLKYGTDGKQGYRSVGLDGKTIKLHSLVASHYLEDYNEKKEIGYEIDHKDNNILNNHKDNLQMMSPLKNRQKKIKQRNNHSGHKNLHTHHKSGNWRYEKNLTIDGKKTKIGYYENKSKINCLCYKLYILLKLNLMKKNNII